MFCIIKKPELYSVREFGLWQAYKHEPNLFNLLSRTHMAFFAYEDLDCMPKLHAIDNIQVYRNCLQQPEVLPWLKGLPKLPKFTLELPVQHLQEIIILRVLQWKKHYRGRLCGMKAQFRSSLTVSEDEFLTQALEELCKIYKKY